ncbi:MAG TPA: serine protease, partial [Planctomycetia bacterium]|nr:serine protease [Planctomycetia bacterium]
MAASAEARAGMTEQVEFFVDSEVLDAAAARWKATEEEREAGLAKLEKGKYTKVESAERLAKRANRMLANVRAIIPNVGAERLSPGLRKLVEGKDLKPEEMDDPTVERVLGETADFLSIDFFERAMAASRAVGRIVTRLGPGRIGYGTGFLVSPQLLMTNHHVFKNRDMAARSTLELAYQIAAGARRPEQKSFVVRPDRFFLNDAELDFALVAVEPENSEGAKLADFGHLPLIADEGKAIIGDPLNIVQHPAGRLKQVVLRENGLEKVLDLFLHDRGDTEPGSSGSPVFNDQWEVVGLHHSGVPKTDSKGRKIDRDGAVWKDGDDPERLAWVANEGIRVSKLVAKIAAARLEDQTAIALRTEFLATGRNAAAAPPLGAVASTNGIKTPAREEPKMSSSEAPSIPVNRLPDENGAAAGAAPVSKAAAATAPIAMTSVATQFVSGVAPDGGAVTVMIPLEITVRLGGGFVPAMVTVNGGGAGPFGSMTAGLVAEGISPDPDDP